MSDEILAAKRWSVEISNSLQNSNYGIICLTRQNQASPWILFEAGAIARSLDEGRVCPFLIDLSTSDLSGPLAQFQAVAASQQGIKELVLSISSASSNDNEADIARHLGLFDALWPKLQEALGSVPDDAPNPGPEKTEMEILREVLDLARLQTRYLFSIDRKADHHPDPGLSPISKELKTVASIMDLLARAKLKRDSKDCEGALRDFKEALALDGDCIDAQIGVLVTQSYQIADDGSYQEIIRGLQRVISQHPQQSKALYNLACILNLERRRSKDPELLKLALSNLKEAIRHYPTYRDIAKRDSDFKDLWNDPGFLEIVNA